MRSVKAPRFRRWLIAGIGLAVIALVLGLVAVIVPGGGKLTLTGTPRQIVLAAASSAGTAKTMHVTVTSSISGTPSIAGQSGNPVSFSISMNGWFDFTHKALTLTATVPKASGKGTEVVQMRVTGPALYVTAPGLPRVDGGKAWVRLSLAQYEQKSGSGDPFSMVSQLPTLAAELRQHPGKITDLGPATVDGVGATIHYRVMLPVTSTSGSSSGETIGSWPVDVWVNGQRQLSQLRLQLPLFGVELSETLTLSNYNSPVSVTPPPANQTANGAGLLASGKLGQVLGKS